MNNKNVVTMELDKNNPYDIEFYEKALYKAFEKGKSITADKVRTYDHSSKRAATKVPYDMQTIYVARIGDKILAAVSANFSTEIMQIELRGFCLESKISTCEILHIFNNYDALNSSILPELGEKIMGIIKAAGINKIYSTCIEKRVIPYRHLGFKVVDSNNFNEEKRYLLLKEI